MTPAERVAHIVRLVDEAPPLPARTVDLLRAARDERRRRLLEAQVAS